MICTLWWSREVEAVRATRRFWWRIKSRETNFTQAMTRKEWGKQASPVKPNKSQICGIEPEEVGSYRIKKDCLYWVQTRSKPTRSWEELPMTSGKVRNQENYEKVSRKTKSLVAAEMTCRWKKIPAKTNASMISDLERYSVFQWNRLQLRQGFLWNQTKTTWNETCA